MDAQAARPLFRPEAVRQRALRRHGEVVLARPISHSFLTLFFSALAASIVLFFAVFGYAHKVQVGGALIPTEGLVRVQPAQAGVVVTRRVREGDTVDAGDILFSLRSERTSGAGGSAESTISSLLQARRESLLGEQSQLRLQANARADAAARRIADLRMQLRRVDEQIGLQQRRVAMSQGTVGRYGDLLRDNFVSPAFVQDKQAELLDQQQRLADLERTKSGTALDLSAAEAELDDLRIQARRDQGAGQRSIAAIEQDLTENEARREIVVRAPKAGRVTAITADVGQSVAASQALATILPVGSTLEAELAVPSRAAGFLRPGMPVLVRYQAYPYQKFGQAHGRVREVSSTSMRPDELTLPGIAAALGGGGEPLYRVRVALDRQTVLAYGVEQPLRSGAVLDASIVLETRRLYEWLLDPLYTVTGRL